MPLFHTFDAMNQRTPHGRRLWLFLIAAIILFLTGKAIDLQRRTQVMDFIALTLKAQNRFHLLEKRLQADFDSIKWNNSHIDLSALENVKEGQPVNLAIYAYKKNKLVYWSNNRVIPDTNALNSWKDHDVINYKNGWFYVLRKKTGDKLIFGLWLIKNQYEYQNKYIVNQFNHALSLPLQTNITVKKEKGTFPVFASNGHYLFSLVFNTEAAARSYGASAGSYLFSIVFALIFILNLLVRLARIRSYWGFLLMSLIFVLRWWMTEQRIPSSLYSLGLFSSKYYASSYYLNSLGDLLINTIIFSLFAVYIYLYIGGVMLVRHAKIKQYTWSVLIVLIILFTFLFSVFVNYLLSGLILNSQISFNINNVFELTTYSIVGIFIIGILLFCFYLVCDGAVRYIQKTHFRLGHVSILFLVSQGLFLLILIWLRDTEVFVNYGVSSFLLANILILFTTYVRRTSRRVFSFTRSLLIVFGFSIYAAFIIYQFNTTKEQERRILLASKLENEHDLVAEYLFTEIKEHISRDTLLQEFLSLTAQQHLDKLYQLDDVHKRLARLYFSGYMGKYDVRFKIFDKNDSPINNIGDPSWDLEAINRELALDGVPTITPGFYYIAAGNGRISYTGIIPMLYPLKQGTVVIQVSARLVQDRSGLPELLLSSNISPDNALQNYSYARYEKNNLVSESGLYNYNLTPKPYEKFYVGINGPAFQYFENYSHLFYQTVTGGLIVISSYSPRLLIYITLFSYIFTFFSIIFVGIYIIVRLAGHNLNLLESFKSRIQFSIVSIVIIALIMVGGATITYIIDNYAQKQNQEILERLNETVVLVENELNDKQVNAGSTNDELIYSFNRLASILSLDFNIYLLDGSLLFTTQPRFYERDLVSPAINHTAFVELSRNEKGIFLQNENISNFAYISAYEPIRNNENAVVGFINLPYYARETELNKEISSFLVALINIYVLLFSIAVFSTIIISNRITQPLLLIQQSLKRTKLGSANDPVLWKRNDEIGALVNEYNRMVEELQQSAEKLARSEREHAWREMAKQVAHEIKNPLTPMKLSVQHLQRAWSDNHPQLNEIVHRISSTLIEQIETLSSIATAFSDFAIMPKAENTKLDLMLILENVVHLYSENENVSVILEEIDKHRLFVLGDKDYIIRIFSNLIKNAIQAIRMEKVGLVKVSVETFIDHYVVAVDDNGQGISNEQRNKIFVPNFTTKSTGTGLGLAMVKALVEGMNGEVWFETEENKGTIFYVRLPAYKESD